MTPWTAARQASLSFTFTWNLLRFISVESVILSNHFILCQPLLLPSIFPRIRVFSSELALCIRWPEYWSFSQGIEASASVSVLPMNIPDWFPLGLTGLTPCCQGTLESLLSPLLIGLVKILFSVWNFHVYIFFTPKFLPLKMEILYVEIPFTKGKGRCHFLSFSWVCWFSVAFSSK